MKLEADEHRQALAAEKNNKVTPARKRSVKEEPGSSSGPGVVKKSKYATKEPVGWETTLDRIREFRMQNPAPVDTMGCERLAEVGDHIPPEVLTSSQGHTICCAKTVKCMRQSQKLTQSGLDL